MNCSLVKRNIRLSCLLHLIFPTIALALIIFFHMLVPFKEIFFPHEIQINEEIPLEQALGEINEKNGDYYSIQISKLRYTGYDLMVGNATAGSYYYYVNGSSCFFVIVDTNTEAGNPLALYDYTITGRISEYDEMFHNMLISYANDIDWTSEGILSISPNYLLDGTEHHLYRHILLFVFSLIMFVISLYLFVTNFLALLFPLWFHSTYRSFRRSFHMSLRYQNTALKLVDMELKNNVRKVIGTTTVITDHFIVDSNRHTSVILPINKIIWIYSHQHLRKIFFWDVSLTSSLTFVTSNGCTDSIHWKPSADARQIFTYFEENYPRIMLKYSKEYKQAAKAIIKERKRTKNI